MKRITDFIVQQRNIILIIFVALAGLSAAVMGRVEINRDMTAYLPETSELKNGLDVMDEEFEPEKTSSLTVMLAGLDDAGKQENLEYLQSMEHVKEVAYDSSEEYNRDNYTRYILTIDDVVSSETATVVYEEVEEHYKDADLTLGGEVAEENHEVLPVWIVALAVGCALVILIIMSNSYVEPFLFLTTILIAVLLNKGTNLIFPNVSNITDSITAILQLALSMDYSIMLMNRYNQEKRHESNKVVAMKQALYHAFQSISSSSVTTIVGLLALVFMSFTIGRDMGFVLAKGVLFSLLAIFTCLPGLILLFDKAIMKTQKKSPAVKLDLLGKAAYKGRYVAAAVFVLIFGASYMLRGNLGITYTDAAEDKISQIFGNDNQIAILYDGKDEEKVAEYCRGLEGEKLDEVLCYGNTIGQKLTVEELPVKMQDLGVENETPDYLLRVAYYHYYRNGQGGRMSLAEFVRFIEEEIYTDENFADHVDATTRANVTKLEDFATADAVLRTRSTGELAQVLGVSAEQMHDLNVYYNSHHVQTRLTAGELVRFLNDYVANSKYGDSIDASARAQLGQMANFVNKGWLETKLTVPEMAEGFGIDSATAEALYNYYGYTRVMEEIAAHPELAGNIQDLLAGQQNLKLTPVEFVDFVLAHKDDTMLAGQIALEMVGKLGFLQGLMRDTLNGRVYTPAEAAGLMGIDAGRMDLIYSLYEIDWQGKGIYLSLNEFVDFLIYDVMNQPEYAGQFDQATRSKIYAVDSIMAQTLAGVTYTPAELVDTLAPLAGNLDQNLIEVLYLYHGSKYDYDASWQLTIEEFVKYLNGNILQDQRFAEFIGEDIRTQVADAVVTVADAKKLLVGENFSRIVLNTSFDMESEETFSFLAEVHDDIATKTEKYYVVGDSMLAYEMSQTFNAEMDMITVITMVFIFAVVALTFKSILVPVILVLLIQCAVFMTMGILSMTGTETYFIALLIVQSILMGATIDYAILYTSYYIEARANKDVKSAVISAYNKSIHAIATSSSILIIVTLIVGNCTTGITAMILNTISAGTICATLLILLLLPAMLAAWDKLIMRRKAVK